MKNVKTTLTFMHALSKEKYFISSAIINLNTYHNIMVDIIM